MWHAGQPPLLLDQNWTLFEVTWRMDTCAKLGKWLYSVHRLPTPGAIIVFSDKWHMHTVEPQANMKHWHVDYTCTQCHSHIHLSHRHTGTHYHSHSTHYHSHTNTLSFTPVHTNSHKYTLQFTLYILPFTHTPVYIAMLFTYTCTHCHSHNCHPTPVHAAICQMALIQQTVSDNIKIV